MLIHQPVHHSLKNNTERVCLQFDPLGNQHVFICTTRFGSTCRCMCWYDALTTPLSHEDSLIHVDSLIHNLDDDQHQQHNDNHSHDELQPPRLLLVRHRLHELTHCISLWQAGR
jgi:hypothetical protein